MRPQRSPASIAVPVQNRRSPQAVPCLDSARPVALSLDFGLSGKRHRCDTAGAALVSRMRRVSDLRIQCRSGTQTISALAKLTRGDQWGLPNLWTRPAAYAFVDQEREQRARPKDGLGRERQEVDFGLKACVDGDAKQGQATATRRAEGKLYSDS